MSLASMRLFMLDFPVDEMRVPETELECSKLGRKSVVIDPATRIQEPCDRVASTCTSRKENRDADASKTNSDNAGRGGTAG